MSGCHARGANTARCLTINPVDKHYHLFLAWSKADIPLSIILTSSKSHSARLTCCDSVDIGSRAPLFQGSDQTVPPIPSHTSFARPRSVIPGSYTFTKEGFELPSRLPIAPMLVAIIGKPS